MKQTTTKKHSFLRKLEGTTRTLLCLMALFLISGANAWGQETFTWTRVTSVETLKSGGIFIIGYEASANSGTIVPMRNTGTATLTTAGIMRSGTTSGSSTGTTLNMTTYSESGADYVVSIEESTVTSGNITIKVGDNFIGNANTKNNCKLFSSDSNNNGTNYTPTIGTNDVITFKNANASYHTFQYNTSSPRFCVYNGGQKNLVIYQRTSAIVTPTVATPTFSPEGGTFTETQTVAINCDTEGATIRYTLDGSEPSESSTVYSTPITLSESTTIKAKAWMNGYDASETATASYTLVEMEVVATPVISPNGGIFLMTRQVAISCDTEDATIYYTLDGNEPSEESEVYNSPITISTTTTIKAMAFKAGCTNSMVAAATFTKPALVNIAEARAMENDQYALVEGIVTFIDGRNVYIQDGTAGIDLYLNNGTVPSTLALGDEVRAYGKKTVYNGLVELKDINGGNAAEFIIESTGNELPNAVKTLAEINADFSGDNMLQSTRVTIEAAILQSLNASGISVIMQGANSLNVYRIPVPEGMIASDWVTLTGVISCNQNTAQLRVASIDDVEFTHRPTIVVTPNAISGLTYEYEQGPSEIANVTISGDYLRGSVFITPSESFELSTSGDDLFHPENPARITPPMSGHIYGIKLYCRMKAGLNPGTYNEQQTIYTQDGDTVRFRLVGTVTGGLPPTPPTGDHYVRITDLSQLTAGSQVVFAARYDDNATSYVAIKNSLDNGKMQSTEFSSFASEEGEILTDVILETISNYYWTVNVTEGEYSFTNANGQVISYNNGTNFNFNGDKDTWTIENGTANPSAMVSDYQGFLIKNVTTNNRAFAINRNYHSCGAYATSNLDSGTCGDYNFYLDLFVRGDDGPLTVLTPTFSPAAGTYYEAQSVTISCATEGATIHYTLDGSNPSEDSPVYTEPLAIDETTTLKAIAMKEDYNNSTIAEATYTIQLGLVVIFNQDWEGEMNGWSFVNVEGETAEWSIAQYSGNHYAYMNAYNHGANEDWCISPAFNLDLYDNPVFSFKNAKNYTGNDLEVYFSNDYDGSNPSTANWTALSCNLSTGNWTWTESGDIDLSGFSGSNCHIGFKYTSTDSAAAGWEIDDCLLMGQTSEAVISASPLILSGFSYMEGNGPSTEQYFTVSALNLSSELTITCGDNFEISLMSGDDFEAQTTISMSPSSGTVNDTPIYVRMIEGLAIGDYEGTITLISNGASSVEISCAGSVVEESIQEDYRRIAELTELTDGNRVILAARYNDNATSYYAMPAIASGKPEGVLFSSITFGTDEILPSVIVNMDESYYWMVSVTANGYTFTNNEGDVLGWTSSTNFNNGNNTEWSIVSATSSSSTMVPDYTAFNIQNIGSENVRTIALNNSYKFGPYDINSNGNSANYNFCLDIFMQGEGGTPSVASPSFSPAAGTYYEAQTVTISCATADAEIFYSLESENGPWESYTEAITVAEDMTLWAYAEKDGYNNSAVASASYLIIDDLVVIFNQDWEDDWNGWTEVSVEGEAAEWSIAQHNGNHYAYMNAYNQGANEDWLVSPAFDLDSFADVVLTFKSAMNYTGPDVEVYFSNDYDGQDPSTATWQALSCNLSQGAWEWTESGEINLEQYSGTNCHIAFRYTSTETEAAGWEIDDILLSSGINTDPTLSLTPNNINGLTYVEGEGPSEAQSYTLSAANLVGEGELTVLVTEGFEISLDAESYGEELEIAYTDGQIVDQPVCIYVRLAEGLEMGTYNGVIMHEGGEAYNEVNLAGEVVTANTPYIDAFMPMYIQGNNGTNNNRIPVAIAVYFENLEANTTYRFVNQFVDSNDGPETNGAGNVIYANPEGFYRSTNPSLSTEGGYGEFTTDSYGEGFAWCINEATANTRFTPGNQVYLRIRINDGHDGTSVDQIFTTEDASTVLNFGTENDEFSGSSFYAKSEESPMSFAMMFAADDDWRPIYSTSIETIGVDYANINQYANFYKEEVAGKNGYFGGILPNNNEYGVNFIWILDFESYIVNDYYAENGMWIETNTVNPSNGLNNPMFIDLSYDNVSEDKVSDIHVWCTGGEICINNPDGGHYMMNVANLLGQTVMTQNVNGQGLIRVNHNLGAGLYIVTLTNNDNTLSAKIIVK